MLERMGAPVYSSVMPKSARIFFCPSACAPAWLPMAGMMNGSAPCSRTTSQTVRTMSAMFAISREPAAMQTLWPGFSCSNVPLSCITRRVSAATSSSFGAERVFSTR